MMKSPPLLAAPTGDKLVAAQVQQLNRLKAER